MMIHEIQYLTRKLSYVDKHNERLSIKDMLQLNTLWERLAVEQGKINIEKLPQKLGYSKTILNQHPQYLKTRRLINEVRQWNTNPGKQLDRQKAWFIRDSGLVHSILGLTSMQQLERHPSKGKSWKSFVLEALLMSTHHSIKAFYYRHQSVEADFVFRFDNQEKWIVEVKWSGDAALSAGFYEACEEIKPSRRFVVHSGPESFKKGSESIDWYCLPDALLQLSRNTFY